MAIKVSGPVLWAIVLDCITLNYIVLFSAFLKTVLQHYYTISCPTCIFIALLLLSDQEDSSVLSLLCLLGLTSLQRVALVLFPRHLFSFFVSVVQFQLLECNVLRTPARPQESSDLFVNGAEVSFFYIFITKKYFLLLCQFHCCLIVFLLSGSSCVPVTLVHRSCKQLKKKKKRPRIMGCNQFFICSTCILVGIPGFFKVVLPVSCE